MAGKARQTAEQLLEQTKAEVAQAMAKLDAKLRASEAAAKAEARLWELARVCERLGLATCDVQVLTPHLHDLAAQLGVLPEARAATAAARAL